MVSSSDQINIEANEAVALLEDIGVWAQGEFQEPHGTREESDSQKTVTGHLYPTVLDLGDTYRDHRDPRGSSLLPWHHESWDVLQSARSYDIALPEAGSHAVGFSETPSGPQASTTLVNPQQTACDSTPRREKHRQGQTIEQEGLDATRWRCRECGRLMGSQSSLKKHEARHSKPIYTCQEPNCNNGTGFKTRYDLDRHVQSVHPYSDNYRYLALVYRCIACHEGAFFNEKLWPRKDNFVAHIRRKHPDRNVDMVVANSEVRRSSERDACARNPSFSQGSGRSFTIPNAYGETRSEVQSHIAAQEEIVAVPPHVTDLHTRTDPSLSNGRSAQVAWVPEAPLSDSIYKRGPPIVPMIASTLASYCPNRTHPSHDEEASPNGGRIRQDTGHGSSNPYEHTGHQNTHKRAGDDLSKARDLLAAPVILPPTKTSKTSGEFPCIDKAGNRPQLKPKCDNRWNTVGELCIHHVVHRFIVCWKCFFRDSSWKGHREVRIHRSRGCRAMCLNPACPHFEKVSTDRPPVGSDEDCECESTPWEQWIKLYRMRNPGQTVPQNAKQRAASERTAKEASQQRSRVRSRVPSIVSSRATSILMAPTDSASSTTPPEPAPGNVASVGPPDAQQISARVDDQTQVSGTVELEASHLGVQSGVAHIPLDPALFHTPVLKPSVQHEQHKHQSVDMQVPIPASQMSNGKSSSSSTSGMHGLGSTSSLALESSPPTSPGISLLDERRLLTQTHQQWSQMARMLSRAQNDLTEKMQEIARLQTTLSDAQQTNTRLTRERDAALESTAAVVGITVKVYRRLDAFEEKHSDAGQPEPSDARERLREEVQQIAPEVHTALKAKRKFTLDPDAWVESVPECFVFDEESTSLFGEEGIGSDQLGARTQE